MHSKLRALCAPVAILLLVPTLLAQKSAPAFPRDGVRKVQENDTIAIWDVSWAKGKSTGPLERRYDQLTIALTDATLKITRPDGTWTVERTPVGGVRFESKGTVVSEEGLSDRGRSMVFELKSYHPPAVAPNVVQFLKEKKEAGFPGQFDAANGGVKLFENENIIIWQKTWNPRGTLHAHYSWIAGVWIQPGVNGQSAAGGGPQPPCSIEKAARTADGWPRPANAPGECQSSDATVAQLRAGTNITEVGAIRFGPPGAFHQEEGLGFPGYSPPAPRAIFVEYKDGPLAAVAAAR